MINPNMKFLTVILLGAFLTSNAQKTITNEILQKELKNSSGIENIWIYSFQLEEKAELYSIDIVNEGMLTEPPLYNAETKMQLNPNIVANSEVRKRIVNSLIANGFLDTIYLRDDTVFKNLWFPADYFEIENPLIVLEIFHLHKGYANQIFIKVDSFKRVERLTEILSADLTKKERKIFKQFRDNIERLKTEE